jgi:hypothetical protein
VPSMSPDSKNPTLRDAFGPAPPYDPLDVHARWHVKTGDPDVEEVVRKLTRVWIDWNDVQRELLLSAAELLADVQRRRDYWSQAGGQARARRLVRDARAAVRLGHSVAATLPPPPWTAMEVAEFMAGLVGFVRYSLRESTFLQPGVAEYLARMALIRMRRATPRRNASRAGAELIADLTWLAGGLPEPINAVTVRRAETNRPLKKNIELARAWDSIWVDMVRLRNLVNEHHRSRLA